MRRPKRFVPACVSAPIALMAVFVAGMSSVPPALASVSPPTVTAVNVFPIAPAASAPLGDVSLTEAAPGQLQVNDVLTFRFEDSAAAATLHFATAGTVNGTNGIAATVAVASSNISGAPLDDEMKITINASSSGGSFPGVLTLSGLTAAADPSTAAGLDKVIVSDQVGTLPAPVTVGDANVISSGTIRAPFAAQSTPTILSTGNNQIVGSVAITEPVKSFFHAGDVITLSLRDVTGSADTVGLAGAPYAAGGSMSVTVVGANGPNVQVNDTSFNVDVVSGDPSQGSASTINISNLVVDTAQAPLGPVTLSAVVSAGPDVGAAPILPGRVSVANVGGNTTTTASGAPEVTVATADQPAGNVAISATAGSLLHNDTISLQVQTPSVTFTGSAPPIATVTSGSLVLDNAASTLSAGDTVATWTVATGNVTAATIAVGPVYYDVGAATPGEAVTLLASGETGSAFTSQVVTDAMVRAAPSVGDFATNPATVPSENAAPFNGAQVVYTEAAAGATPAGSSLVLISPYATQIAAYRTTFSTIPSAVTTGGLTLGTPVVNSSALVVATPDGSITAPAQTVAIFPVTAASSAAGTATISGLGFQVGSFVPPGALVVSGVVEASGGTTSALAGNEVVDVIDTHNLGTSSATTPPTVSFTETPPLFSNLTSGTFAFVSDEAGSTFACALDGTVVSLNCPSPLTLPSLTQGSHTFTVQAFNPSQYGSAPLSYSWTVDSIAPTATVTLPTSLTGPVTASFSTPVEFLNSSTVTLSLASSSAPLAATLTCQAQGGIAGPCTDTSFYVKVFLTPAAALVPGQHYTLVLDPASVTPAITDEAGNVLATSSDSFRGGLVQQENSPAAIPSWSTVKSSAASGGSYAVAHLAGATTSFSFTGSAIIWHTVTGPAEGDAYVYVDGARIATVDNYASSVHFGVARTVSGLSSGPHVLKILVRGVKGSASGTDTKVAIDDFVVGSTKTQQNGRGVTYTWRSQSAKSASGGAYGVDDLPGAAYSFTFRGVGIKWNTVLGPAMGEAKVYIDGVLKTTVNNYAKSLTYKKGRAWTGLADGLHTIRIVVLGKHSASSTGSKVAVDSFVVS